MINFENLDKCIFDGAGPYGIPQIEPVTECPKGEFIPANFHYKAEDTGNKIVHFFLDDYQFIRYWKMPDKYIPRLSAFQAVCAPDFSTYTDMPPALQIYNHYRKHWLAAYWQQHGMTVYPTVSWSDEKSYAWCFDGEPVGGVVAVSSVGTQKSRGSKRLFLQGYEEMLRRLSPQLVIFYGAVLEECGGEKMQIEPYYTQVKQRARVKEK